MHTQNFMNFLQRPKQMFSQINRQKLNSKLEHQLQTNTQEKKENHGRYNVVGKIIGGQVEERLRYLI